MESVKGNGRYGNEDAMWVFRRALPPEWLIVAPRAILADPKGGYSWIMQERDSWPPMSAFNPAVDALIQLVDMLPQLYRADPSRICLMGFSQGTAVAFAAALQYPERFKAIASLLGFLPRQDSTVNNKAAFNKLPIFFASGSNDPYIPKKLTANTTKMFQEAGAKLTHQTYNHGHKLNAQAVRDLKAWWQIQRLEIGD